MDNSIEEFFNNLGTKILERYKNYKNKEYYKYERFEEEDYKISYIITLFDGRRSEITISDIFIAKIDGYGVIYNMELEIDEDIKRITTFSKFKNLSTNMLDEFYKLFGKLYFNKKD